MCDWLSNAQEWKRRADFPLAGLLFRHNSNADPVPVFKYLYLYGICLREQIDQMDLGLYRSISAGLPDSPSAAAFAQPSQTVNAEVMQQLSRSSEPPAGSLAARHVLEASGCKLADSSLIDGCSSFYAATSSHDQPATKQKAAGAAAAQQHNHHLATGFVTGTLHLPCSAETVTRLRCASFCPVDRPCMID